MCQAQSGCHALFGFQHSETTLTVNFADSTISSTTITSWLWDFGDGHSSTSHNPHHTYAHAGTYEVCLTVHNNHGCSSTYCHPVTVSTIQPECHALFGFQQSDTTFTVNFADSTISSTPITSWLWDFGDGHSSTNHYPHHTYAHAGTYEVCLTVHNNHGCNSTYCHTVTIHATGQECIALFTSHYNSKSNQMRFFNTSSFTTDHTQYLWSFGDGHSSTSENPIHTYSHTGSYTVCLFISDGIAGCNSHLCTEVEINHIWHAMVTNKDHILTSRSKPNEVIALDSNIEFGSFPNPFIINTNIPYELKSDSHLNIDMYDLSGRLIHQIFKGVQSKGSHTLVLSGDYLIDKMYILKIVINDKIFHKKLLVAN
ncbi:MAG: PKD domain-containing protein [Saprospiraceae bacterium]|nr:PKD domain-containing protein [Saprospiraceae bacterium]